MSVAPWNLSRGAHQSLPSKKRKEKIMRSNSSRDRTWSRVAISNRHIRMYIKNAHKQQIQYVCTYTVQESRIQTRGNTKEERSSRGEGVPILQQAGRRVWHIYFSNKQAHYRRPQSIKTPRGWTAGNGKNYFSSQADMKTSENRLATKNK